MLGAHRRTRCISLRHVAVRLRSRPYCSYSPRPTATCLLEAEGLAKRTDQSLLGATDEEEADAEAHQENCFEVHLEPNCKARSCCTQKSQNGGFTKRPYFIETSLHSRTHRGDGKLRLIPNGHQQLLRCVESHGGCYRRPGTCSQKR